MVAFNKMTGEEVWMSESLEDNPSYTSPLLIEWAGNPLIVNVSENYVFGVDPRNGSIRWTFNYGQFAGGEWRSKNHINTPVYENGELYISNGYDHTSVMIELSDKGDAAYFKWADTTLDVHHGGVVKVGDYLYGATWEGNRMGKWACLEWETGNVMYETEWENKGSIIAAEGMLYCYEEKNGKLALVKASPDGFSMISTFTIPYGKGPHWPHPVIGEGILYIRHGQAVMAYSIKETNR
jgi:outer membrane protein assembly factor BamB